MDLTSLAAGLLEPVPANAALGIKVTRAAGGGAEVSMPEATDAANVIGSMHSSGLIALIDAAGLAAVIAMTDERAPFENVVALGANARLEFLGGSSETASETRSSHPPSESWSGWTRGSGVGGSATCVMCAPPAGMSSFLPVSSSATVKSCTRGCCPHGEA